LHQAIQRVTEDIEAIKFNTALAALMEFSNALAAHLAANGSTPAFQEAAQALIRLLAPFAPHIAEELWQMRRSGPRGDEPGADSVHRQAWPAYDPALTVAETITLVIQVNGKVRDRIQVPAGIGEEEARRQALSSEKVQRYLDGSPPRQVIVVPGTLVNVVV